MMHRWPGPCTRRSSTPTSWSRRPLERPAVLYIDLHLIHEVTSRPRPSPNWRARGLKVRRPDRTVATMDHSTPTLPPGRGRGAPLRHRPAPAAQVEHAGEANCSAHGDAVLHDWDSPHRGVVHVIGPELGLTQPGMTVVCGDSHTATHGAFGALGLRHRHQRGRPRAGHPDPAAAPGQADAGDVDGRLPAASRARTWPWPSSPSWASAAARARARIRRRGHRSLGSTWKAA